MVKTVEVFVLVLTEAVLVIVKMVKLELNQPVVVVAALALYAIK